MLHAPCPVNLEPRRKEPRADRQCYRYSQLSPPDLVQPQMITHRKLFGLAFASILAVSAFAQTTPPTQGGGQTTGQTGQTTGQGTGQGTGQVEDPLAKLRESTKGSVLSVSDKGITIDPIGAVKANLSETVRFQARARVAGLNQVTTIFSLNNGPDGATIDPYSGWFTWVPEKPGTYAFDILATDAVNVTRFGSTRVVINVERKLEFFGYSFFAAARSAIQARVMLAQSGLYRPGIPLLAGGQPGQGGTLPDGTPINAATLNALREIQMRHGMQVPQGPEGMRFNNWLDSISKTNAPLGGNGTGMNGNLPQNGLGGANNGGLAGAIGGAANGGTMQGQNNQGQGQNQGTGQGNQGLGNQGTGNQGLGNQGLGNQNQTGGLNQGNQGMQNTGNVSIPPYSLNDSTLVPNYRPNYSTSGNQNVASTAQISAQLIDALRYFVGPFDMMSGNVFVPAPDRYQLGPGDILFIRYSSPTMEAKEISVAIDERGAVVLPPSGRKIVLRGKTLDSAEKAIRDEIAKDILNPNVSVSLKELRTMALTIIGEAFQPGSYQVPAVATLFNALYMAGGPSDLGSLRKIELRRTDGSRRVFDMYQFLVFGDSKQDVPLQPGDTIFIPVAGPRIRVIGEVGRPGIYEMLPNEKLKDAMKFAGDAKPTGVTQRVGHTTVDPGKSLIQRDVNLEGTTPDSNPPVYADDIIEVYSVRPVITNVVTLEGAVDQPGQYALSQGLTVKSLIERARGALPEANLARADIFRQNDDKTLRLVPIDLGKALAGDPQHNIALELYDRVRIYRVDEVQWMGDRQVFVKGAVRRPGTFARADGMRVVDLLIQAGGLEGDAFMEQGFLQRRNSDNTMGELIRIDFRKVSVGDPAHNVVLQDRDELTIQTRAEASYVPEQVVRILGAVQKPGEYAAASNMKVKDLIQLAGGLMPNVSDTMEIARARVPEGTAPQILRVADVMNGLVDPDLTPGDLVTIPTRSDFQMTTRTVVLLGAVKRPGPYSINSTSDKITDIIDRAGGLTENAFPKGAQFIRDPAKLKTLFQTTLVPRMREVLDIIAEDEYLRAAAKAKVEILRLEQSANQKLPSIPIPGFGTASTGSTTPTTLDLEGKETVTRARKLRLSEVDPAGNLSMRLEDALKNKKSAHNLTLEQGDIIIIPEKPSTVFISGAVVNSQALTFEPGKNLMFYLNKAQSMPDADLNMIYVIRANGEVVKGRGNTRIELGDMIFVPTKVMAARLTDKQAEIDAISRNITSAGLIFTIIRALGGG